ncbi:MAG: DciA family protein, partial [Pseudomonadota bacterium]
SEIVGQDTAAIARPVKVGYGRAGIGATLTLLTTGPQAPLLEMQKEQLRGKVNAVYGYNAISRIRITQTAATGFAEGQASFEHKPKHAKPEIAPDVVAEADNVSRDINDGDLRAALERLGRNVLSKQKR